MGYRHKVSTDGPLDYPVCPLNQQVCINWKGFQDSEYSYCAFSFEGVCAVFDFLTAVPHALLGDEAIKVQASVCQPLANRVGAETLQPLTEDPGDAMRRDVFEPGC